MIVKVWNWQKKKNYTFFLKPNAPSPIYQIPPTLNQFSPRQFYCALYKVNFSKKNKKYKEILINTFKIKLE